MGEISPSEKRELLSFLESHYNIPREELHDLIDDSSIPEDLRDLGFIKNKIIYSENEVVGSFSLEFRSRVEYLEEFIKLNLEKPPGFRDGYVDQIKLSNNAKRKARKRPRLTTESLVSEEDYKSIINSIENQVNFLESEIENCDFNQDVMNQLHLIIALMKYALDSKSSANIKNSFRPLSYISAHSNLSQRRHSHSYSKIGHKLEVMFEDTDTIPEKLLPYYDDNIKSLVSTIEKSVEKHKSKA